jgi:hypothetical protein
MLLVKSNRNDISYPMTYSKRTMNFFNGLDKANKDKFTLIGHLVFVSYTENSLIFKVFDSKDKAKDFVKQYKDLL